MRPLRAAASVVLSLVLVATTAPAASSSHDDIDRPNILLIVTDDQKADWLGGSPFLTSSGRPYMPTTQELFEAGTVFRNAFVPTSVCCPSRASILTGQYSHTNGVWDNGPHGGFAGFDDGETVATWLTSHYRTGFFGKYLNGYNPSVAGYVPPGWERWFVHATVGYFGSSFSDQGVLVESDGAWAPERIADEVVDFVGEASGEPFFAVVAPYLPHKAPGQDAMPQPNVGDELLFADEPPYRPPSYNEKDIRDKPRWVRFFNNGGGKPRPRWDAEKQAFGDEFRLNQYRVLFGWDRELDRILGAIRDAGAFDDTVFIFISDNGFVWGEHRLDGKNKPYDAAVRVPFAISCGAAVGCALRTGVVRTLASNIDLAPTIASFAELRIPRRVDVDGIDLTLPTDRRMIALEHVVGGGSPTYCGVRTPKEVFVRYDSGEEEYYHYGKDPWEQVNRAGRKRFADRVDRLRARARAMCDPRPPGFRW